MEKVEFLGLQNCYRIFNNTIDLIATTEIGPNIVRFGFVGERNEFFPKTIYGITGHILRHAPESQKRFFFGTDPVTIERCDKFIRLTQPTEKPTGIQKELDIPLSIDGNHVSIVHRLYNRGLWTIELAPWTSTLMLGGGTAVLPLPPRVPHGKDTLLPTSLVAIWPYCNLSDERLILGKKYVMLKQDDKVPGSYKLGMLVSDGWTAYYNNGHLFVITFDYKKGAPYPDFGCSVEVNSGEIALELETLAPLSLLQPEASVEYTENWFLFRGIPELQNDNDIDKNILPLIQKIKLTL
jgi:hypothetical protein